MTNLLPKDLQIQRLKKITFRQHAMLGGPDKFKKMTDDLWQWIEKNQANLGAGDLNDYLNYVANVGIYFSMVEKKPNIFRIDSSFLMALNNKANLHIDASFLIDRMELGKVYQIEMPQSHWVYVDAGSEYVQGYRRTVLIHKSKVNIIGSKEIEYGLILVAPYFEQETDRIMFDVDCEDGGIIANSVTGFRLIANKNVLEIKTKGLVEDEDNFFLAAIKSLFYILSDGNPDLRTIKSDAPITTKNPKKMKRQLIEKELFPVINVGFGFAKSPLYVKNSWDYLRWQPYGSKAEPKYKLIHITAHRRKGLVIEC